MKPTETLTGSPLRRLPTAGVAVLLALLVGPPAAQVAAQSLATHAGPDDYVWKDPDGNPLPFQTHGEILDFLRTAEFESVDSIELGVTNPRQVVLERDGVRMRAALRDYDQTFTQRRFEGVFYTRLRDSYVFDIPAYKLSRVIGLDAIPPVTLRRVGGEQVSLQAWVEGAMMETERIAEDIDPPSLVRFRRDSQDMRVFDSLIGNVDRNTGNQLYDGNWNRWLIDHSRSFMRNDDTYYLDRVTGCSRWLYEALKELTFEQLEPLLSPPLTESEVRWTITRRDKIIAHIDALIAERGEGAVLFEGRE